MSDKPTQAIGRYEVSGPYHYEHDVHACFRIDGPHGIVATAIAFDGDEDAAYERALVMVKALEVSDAG